MRIYYGEDYTDVNLNDESSRYRSIMSDNTLTIKFSLSTYFEFPIDSYCQFEGQEYRLLSPQTLKKVDSNNFEYTLIMGGYQELLENYKIKDSSGRVKFSATASPQDQLQILVDTLNDSSSDWTIGSYITQTEKVISYNQDDCFSALNKIAEAFETEWEIIDKAIHLKKVEYNKESPLALSYGKGNGFKSGVGRTNDGSKTGFNVLYVQGGDRNIDVSIYGNNDLLLPISQEYELNDVTYESSSDGLFIVKKDVTITNRKEASIDLTNIYPKKEGAVTSVVTVNEDANLYDIVDTSIDIDFNDYIIAGNALTIIFQSGILTGKEFEVNYIHASKKFEIVPQEIDGVTMPNETYIPSVSDTYAVFNMMLPPSYISDNALKTGASWDMFKEACKYFNENENSDFTFTGELDGIWASSDWENIGGKIKLGGYITFSDTQFQPTGIDIRIIGIKDFINSPQYPTIELSNSTQRGGVVSALNTIKANEVVSKDQYDSSITFTKRRFRDAQESIKLLQDAQLDFDSSIRPLTVETMQILLGDESLQYRFVDSKVTPVQIAQTFSFNTSTKVFTSTGGILQHMTLGVDAIKPRLATDYSYWTIPEYNSSALTDSDQAYYIYAKCSKSAETGVFILSETAIGLEDIPGYYHLLAGVLNSEYLEDRSAAKMYGFTEILPGQIKVDEITSGDGLQWIKFLADKLEIKANVEFSTDSPAMDQVADSIHVGGRNLILISEILESVQAEKVSEKKVSFDYNGVLINTEVAKDTDFKENTTYGLRFKFSSDQVLAYVRFKITYTDTSYDEVSSTIDEFVEYFTPNTKTVSSVEFFYYPGGSHPAPPVEYAYLEEWELVEGNKFIGWNPAPEDLGYLGMAFDNKTNITGGLLASSLIKLGAVEETEDDWVEKTGMSGLPNDNIGFYTGGTYDDALDNLVKTLLRKDGSGYFAGGNIDFDTSGNLIVKAIIEALSGKIGAFEISANGISTNGITLDTSDIEALVDIGGSDTETTLPASAVDNVSNETIDTESVSEAYVESISITKQSRLRFGINTTVSNINTSSSLVQVLNADDDVVFADLTEINNIKEYDVSLPSGTYKITLVTRGFTTDDFNTNNNSITAIAGETKILVEPVSAITKIANNGIYSYWGSDKYFYFEKTHGMQVRFGSYVFRINSADGIQKSANGGSSWTSL